MENNEFTIDDLIFIQGHLGQYKIKLESSLLSEMLCENIIIDNKDMINKKINHIEDINKKINFKLEKSNV